MAVKSFMTLATGAKIKKTVASITKQHFVGPSLGLSLCVCHSFSVCLSVAQSLCLVLALSYVWSAACPVLSVCPSISMCATCMSKF